MKHYEGNGNTRKVEGKRREKNKQVERASDRAVQGIVSMKFFKSLRAFEREKINQSVKFLCTSLRTEFARSLKDEQRRIDQRVG